MARRFLFWFGGRLTFKRHLWGEHSPLFWFMVHGSWLCWGYRSRRGPGGLLCYGEFFATFEVA